MEAVNSSHHHRGRSVSINLRLDNQRSPLDQPLASLSTVRSEGFGSLPGSVIRPSLIRPTYSTVRI